MPTQPIADLDDLSVTFEGRGTPTLLDSAITLPDSYNPNYPHTFTITGLESTDTVTFQESANLYFHEGSLFAVYPDYSANLGFMSSSGPGTFIFTVSPFVLRPFLERALEALVFSTTDERETSTRQLGYSLSNIFDPGNDITGTINVTLEGPTAVAPVILIDLTETAVFNTGSFDQGAQLLDSDVAVTLDAGFDATGAVLSVSGLAQGDTVNLRLQGAGSPFTMAADPALPPGAMQLYMDGDLIGLMTPGYDTGSEQSLFQVQFASAASAATIEAVIENIQFATTADAGSRTLSLALTANDADEPLLSQDIAVSLVPEIGGMADTIWIDTADPDGPLTRMTDVPAGDYSGGKLTINGLIGRIDVPGIASGSMFSMDNPDQTQGDTYNVYWYSSHFATITIPPYHQAGDLVVDFIMSGTGSGLVESFMNELRFKMTGASYGFGATRDLTITVETPQGITAQSTAPLTYGKPELSGVDSPDPMKAGTAPALLDDDVTVALPTGVTLDGARVEVTGLAVGDTVGLSDAGPFRVDGAGNLILTGGAGDLTIGTFAAGSAGYDAQTGLLVSSPAVIGLNEDAPSWVLETLIENLNLSSSGRFSADGRTLTIAIYNASDRLWTSADVNVSVSGHSIDGLKQIHYNENGGNIYYAPFVDTSISLAPGDYTGWTLEVSAANGQLGDTVWIGQNYMGNRHFYLQSQPDQSVTLYYVNDFGHPSPMASYTGLANQNGIGFGFRLQVAHDSTWNAAMLEHLIESVTMLAGGPDGTTSSVTYKLSNPQGVFYEDTVQVVKTGPVPGLDGLASAITVNLAVTALDGPALIDSDVTVPETFSSGLLAITVAGAEPGDVLGLRTFDTPAAGQLGLTGGGMLYRQVAGDVELLGYVSGGEGTPLRIEFFVGVTAAQVEAVVEALTFDSTSTAANRELVVTLLQNGNAAARGFVEVNLDRTPLIEGLSRTVQFDAATIATTPMTIDSDVTLPTGISYANISINIWGPSGVQIGVGGDYRVESDGGNDSYVFRGETVIAYWGGGYLGDGVAYRYISFGSGATREDVEAVMEALTFTSTVTDTPLQLTISLDQSGAMVARTEITLQPAVGDQTLTGTAAADTLTGGAGNDLILGLEGDDLLSGLDGNDTLSGGEGNDSLLGGAGRDDLDGGVGDDTARGGSGNDTLRGNTGHDLLEGDEGRDWLFGGTGNDTLRGGAGDDILNGHAGHDLLDGGAGSDRLEGAAGNDTLNGGTGADSLFGGDGADSLSGAGGSDSLYGGAGDDWLNGGWSGDMLEGGSGADTLGGGEGDDSLYGGADADLIRGGTGNDLLSGGEGGDRLAGGAGNDTLLGGTGADWMNGGDGADIFVFALADLGTGVDRIAGFVQGEDRIALASDLTAWLQSAGGSAADALVWDAATGRLSLDPAAVGLTGGPTVIAQLLDAGGLVLGADDLLFL